MLQGGEEPLVLQRIVLLQVRGELRDLTVERLTKPYVQMPLKKRFQGGDFYADILTPYSDEDFTACWERAAEDSISWVTVKVISKADQIARLRRSEKEKHARDVALLERALADESQT